MHVRVEGVCMLKLTSVRSHSRSRLRKTVLLSCIESAPVDKAMHVLGWGVCMLKQRACVAHGMGCIRLCAL
jgi:hypothetical protein